ncbi:MAG: hypothetical protein ABJB76_11255 [Candidatus Nitrosocosmicus sp.]
MRANLIEHYTNILKTIVYLNSVSQTNGTIVESISSLTNHIIIRSSEVTDNEDITTGKTTTTINEDSNTQPNNSNSNNNSNNQQSIIAVMNYLKFTGFIDYYIDNMKKDKITITISPVISAFLLQYYFEISNVLDSSITGGPSLLKDPKHKEDEKILLLQKLFVTSSMVSSGASGAAQSTSIEY